MKNSNLIKIFSILLISVMIMMFSTNVLAADDGFNQLTLNTNSSNTTANNTNTQNTNTDTANRSAVNTNNTNNTNTRNTNTNNTTNTNTRNNSSVYNNTNLPKTGIEDSIPVALLVVIFGISAIYAYKKIKDYRNI